ncbi:hypothetical protein GCM10010492_59820 [Saccharothrix mutabilis subsp. mutabilis]|uniref:NACHT domain-containing protein n=1 Tax=Saccharothrix mutabilis subsp. mutabilis TaxID=66855 RepID=A0ABN0UI73_9PSEU
MLALWSLTLVAVSAALAVATNAASSSTQPWPWGLRVFQRYPWQGFAVLVAGAMALTLLTLRRGWRAEDEAARAASASPEALNAVAESLAVTFRDEIDDELRTRALGTWIDLPVRVDPAGPTTLDAVVAGLGRGPRRVVLTGAAGSGKSTALLMVARQLLRGRDDRAPVPVLVNLSTWNPAAEGLDEVVRRRLGPPGRRRRGPEPIDVVSTRRVLPVLDGVDELPEALWPAARSALARTLDSPDREFVLACTAAALEAIVPEECLRVGGTRVVALGSVGVEESIAYLATASRGDARRWDPVFDLLRAEPDGVAARALSSPLLLHLASVVYRERGSQPGELVDDAVFPTSGDIERHLLSHYLTSAYGGESVRVHRWLGSIAALLTFRRSTEFVWWNAGLPSPFPDSAPPTPRRPADRGAWRLVLLRLKTSFRLTLIGVAAVVAAHLQMTYQASRQFGPPVELAELARRQDWWAIALFWAATFTVSVIWVRLTVSGSEARSGLRAQLAADLRTGLMRGGYLAVVLGSCAAAAVAVGWPFIADYLRALLPDEELRDVRFPLDVPDTPDRWLLAVAVGAAAAVVAFTAVFWRTAWFRFRVAAVTSAALRRTPLRLVGFLEDAHKRGVLRRNGEVLQFRHRTVQWHLARPLPPRSAREVIAETERALAETDDDGALAALRRLEAVAFYDRSARAAWNRLHGDRRCMAPLPHLLAARRAIAWWEAVIDSGADDATAELSDLYDWLLAIQPPGLIGVYLSARADSFAGRTRTAAAPSRGQKARTSRPRSKRPSTSRRHGTTARSGPARCSSRSRRKTPTRTGPASGTASTTPTWTTSPRPTTPEASPRWCSTATNRRSPSTWPTPSPWPPEPPSTTRCPRCPAVCSRWRCSPCRGRERRRRCSRTPA